MLAKDFESDSSPHLSQSQEELAAIRTLLLGPEQRKLARLEDKIRERPVTSAADVAAVLPRSVKLSAGHDLRSLAEALFPVIGPAIRRAIASALREMVQSLNLVVERSLSPRAWVWRVEALRTGRPFAEIALARSVVYRVEHVFLIRQSSGLLLADVGRVPIGDADVVSGMLVAITDFVHDSFSRMEPSPLEELHLGAHTVFFERGGSVILAAVVRGLPPVATLRAALQDAIAAIERELASVLVADVGDTTAYADARPHLERCMLVQTSEQALGRSRLGSWLLLLLALLLVSWGGVSASRSVGKRRTLDRELARLRAEPGIVILHGELRGRERVISGLADPLAQAPLAVLYGDALPVDPAELHFAPYLSLDPLLVLRRAHHVLSPPASISLHLRDATLHASGRAPHRWIVEAERLAPVLPGITRFDCSKTRDEDLEALLRSRRQLTDIVIYFHRGKSEIEPSESGAAAQAGRAAAELWRAGRELGLRVEIQVIGQADAVGNERTNLALSGLRAASVLQHLASYGLPREALVAKGEGATASQAVVEDRGRRIVSFVVRVTPDGSLTDRPLAGPLVR